VHVAVLSTVRRERARLTDATVHRGFFDASLKPVLTIDSGDIVRLETASGNPRCFESIGVPKELKHLASAWHEVDPSDPVREAAVRS